jgi:hypothetical protein
MKLIKFLFIFIMIQFIVISAVTAKDFGWTEDFNIQAQADPSGFKARLAARFNLGDVQVRAVLSNFQKPSDAYIMLRLGEMSDRSTEYVLEKYRSNKTKGWGALAKSLGIKPGSEEFHALKIGHDLNDGGSRVEVLYSTYESSDNNYKDNGHGKGRWKNKVKN